jgi:phosphoglycolate phosphatase
VKAVLFDLDGCLADSQRTILDGMNLALDAHGLGARPDAELVGYIGPPTRVAFGHIMGLDPDAPEVDAVVATYREHYTDGLKATTTFPGVPEMLDALLAQGLRLGVATSKPRHFAVPVLEVLGLLDRFAVVAGPELTGTAGKAETIAEAIAGLDGAEPVAHVGDRRHDVEGAQTHGLFAVGVLWGIGSREELEGAGADALVESPDQLVPLLDEVASARRASRPSSTETTGP